MMKVISLSLTFYTVLLIVAIVEAAKKKKGPQCDTCKEIVKKFHKGVEKTKKSNYGGGNTDWEERALGDYANSEVRLVEIMDELCDGASKECHQMLEQHEETVEEFWFNSGLHRTEEEFHQFFCIGKVKACCPNNTYGPDCKECTGGKDRPCLGNGKCNGEGTRGGTGKCQCNHGYKGELCDSCLEGYYEHVKNATDTVCNVCHIACKTSCTGDGAKVCDACKEGWNYNEETGCEDVNECESGSSSPCQDTEYCTNTQGSYSCLSCHVACKGCTGSGFNKCVLCNDGYLLKDGECLDVDECTSEGHEGLCTLEGQKCINTAGSFKCICQDGYIKHGDGCTLKPEETESKWLDDKDDKENGEKDNTAKPDQQGPTDDDTNIDTPPGPKVEL